MIFRNDLVATATATATADTEADKSQMKVDRPDKALAAVASASASAIAAVTTTAFVDPLTEENNNRENNNDRNGTKKAVVESTEPAKEPVANVTETAAVAVPETTPDVVNVSVPSPVMVTVRTTTPNDLIIEIPDALSEKDGIKFTIQTRTELKEFRKSSFSVIRDHDDFVWLHARFTENANYAGFIIPPIPPRPDFELSREKLMTLSDGEGHITESEFHQMKQELEAEYLAAFKKTVNMHEVFLTRLARHSAFKKDVNFQVFLEYGTDLCAKPKSKLESIGSFMKSIDILNNDFITNVKLKDFDDFFQRRKLFLHEYYSALKECANSIDRMTDKQKEAADSYLKIANHFITLLTINPGKLDRFLSVFVDLVQDIRKTERRLACDQDLKLGDTIKYYQGDTRAAKELLTRRLRFLAAYESANKALDKARNRNKPTVDVQKAEVLQTKAFERFNLISSQAKVELIDFRNRCLVAFRKSLTDLAELEIKHATSKRNFYANALKLFEDEEIR